MKIFIYILSVAIIANFIVGISTIIALKFRLKEFKLKIVKGITLTIAPGITYYHKANKKELKNLNKIRFKRFIRVFIPLRNAKLLYFCINQKNIIFLCYSDVLSNEL